MADAYELLSIGFGSKPPVEYLDAGQGHGSEGAGNGRHAGRGSHLAGLCRDGWEIWTGSVPSGSSSAHSSSRPATSWPTSGTRNTWRRSAGTTRPFREIKRAQQLDPAIGPRYRAVGWVLYFARRYDQAIEELQKALAMDADFLGARLVLWWVHVAKGTPDAAIADIRKELEKPGLRTVKKLMLAYALRRRRATRKRPTGILWELEAKLAGENRLALLSALLFTALDMKDRAFQQLHRAYELREPGLLFLKVAPWLDPPGPTRAMARSSSSWDSADRPGASRPSSGQQHPLDASSLREYFDKGGSNVYRLTSASGRRRARSRLRWKGRLQGGRR